MRRLLACLVIALALPTSAAATSMPPFRGLPKPVAFVRTGPQQTKASCSSRHRSAKSSVLRFANRLAPVACEQPPRAKLRSALPTGSFLGP